MERASAGGRQREETEGKGNQYGKMETRALNGKIEGNRIRGERCAGARQSGDPRGKNTLEKKYKLNW